MSSCWDERPESRPHFSQLISNLTTFLGNIAEYFNLSSTDQAISGCGECTALPDAADSKI